MMYNDEAFNPANPFPGQVFNIPGTPPHATASRLHDTPTRRRAERVPGQLVHRLPGRRRHSAELYQCVRRDCVRH